MNIVIGIGFFCGVLLVGSDGGLFPWVNVAGLGLSAGCVWAFKRSGCF
jgi:hypothetical protein